MNSGKATDQNVKADSPKCQEHKYHKQGSIKIYFFCLYFSLLH